MRWLLFLALLLLLVLGCGQGESRRDEVIDVGNGNGVRRSDVEKRARREGVSYEKMLQHYRTVSDLKEVEKIMGK